MELIKRFSNSYEPILWLIITFVAGAINSLLIYVPFVTLVKILTQLHNQSQNLTLTNSLNLLYQIPLLFAISFFLPLIVSIMVTRSSRIKLIIPPFFIQLVTIGVLLFAIIFQPISLDMLPVWIFMLIFLGMAGYGQDSFVTGIFGRDIKIEDMIQYSFKSENNLSMIENAINKKDVIRERLNLDKNIEEIQNGIIMKSPNHKFQWMLELISQKDDKTIINAVFFEKGRYYFQKSDELIEYARDKTSYLETILKDSKIKSEPVTERNADSLAISIINEHRGFESQLGTVTRNGKIKIIGFILATALSIGLVVTDHLGEGIASLAGIFLFLAFELPNRLIHRRHRV
jgi:hypothetical protein